MTEQTAEKMNTSNTHIDPRSFNHPGRETLMEEDVEGVAKALINLSKEVWVLADRLRILEAVLEENGINAHDAIERFQPDQTLQTELNENGQAMISRVLESFKTQPGLSKS